MQAIPITTFHHPPPRRAARLLTLAGTLGLLLIPLFVILRHDAGPPLILPPDESGAAVTDEEMPTAALHEFESASQPPRPRHGFLAGRSPEGLSLHVLRYIPVIVEVGHEVGVDPATLAALMEVESSGEEAISPAGALGLMQVMPDKLNPGDDPFDPSTNIRRAAQLVQRLSASWKGDLTAVAGSYFGAVDNHGFVTEASDGIVTGSQYVSRFADAYERWASVLGQSAQPVMIQTRAPASPILRYTVQPGDSARGLAVRYGISLATLAAANELSDPDVLQVGQELRIPSLDGVLHSVQSGESLSQLAERYGVSISSLLEANRLVGELQAGALLVVPGAAPAWPAEPTAAEPPPPPPPPVPAAPRRVSSAPPPPVTARHVAILDEASGELLYGQDEHNRVAPASITKIATTLVALEREPDLEKRIRVTISGSAMAARDGSSIMGLEPGRQVSLTTLLYGMMLPSGNDAAEQVALSLAGSRQSYVGWMNDTVTQLGLQDTHFVNPSGMDASGHYSSAHDMALLGRTAMRNETFRQLAGASSYRGDGYSLGTLNRLIGAYPGVDGIKIGLTRQAGRTIVASATRDGHRVYVSLLRSQDTPSDSTALFEWVWRTFNW
jgi:D-alanyl-D-alanine carboxypeptidase